MNAGSVQVYYNWKTFLFAEHLDTAVCARILAKAEKKQQKELHENGKQMTITAMFNKTLQFKKKKKVKMQVYSLVSSAKRHSPDFTQLPPGHRACSYISHASQLPGEHTARLPFSAHGTVQTHKPSLSYHVPTYSWVERVHVWAKCLAQEHNVEAYSAQSWIEPGISRLYVAHATTEPRRPPKFC